MRKIIIDTNVIVSSLIQKGYPFYIVNNIFANNDCQLCISENLFEEYYEVLNRDKFAKFPGFLTIARIMLVNIEAISKK